MQVVFILPHSSPSEGEYNHYTTAILHISFFSLSSLLSPSTYESIW